MRQSSDTVKLNRLIRLSELTREMMRDLGTISLEDQLKRIAEAGRETLNAETCGVFLVTDKERERGQELSLEASAGHRAGGFQRGRRLPIASSKGGLTSHIAFTKKLFNGYGSALIDHFAVADKNDALDGHHTAGRCYSLLAVPLLKKSRDGQELVGLLRVDNKQRPNGTVITEHGFDKVDEWIIQLFADIAVVAIENAELVHYRTSLISSCPSGIIAVDREGKVTEINPSAARILGRSRDEAMHHPLRDFYLDPDEPRRIAKMLYEGNGSVDKYQTAVKGADGEPIPIVHSSTWLFSGGSSGQRVGSVGYFEDVRMMRKLERRDQLLQAIDLVAKTSDMEEGLQQFTAKVVSVVGRSYCAVRLADDQEQFLTMRAATRSDDPSWRAPIGTRIAIDDCPGLRDMLSGGVPAIRLWEDERFRTSLQILSKTMGFDRHLRSVLICPLKMGDKIIGLLELGDRRGAMREMFTADEELDHVGTVAAQVSVLMDRLRLLEHTHLRENRLEELASVAAALPLETEPATLLFQVAGLAAALVEYEVGGIYLLDASTKQFALREGYGLPRNLVAAAPVAESFISTVGVRRETHRARSLTLAAEGAEANLVDVLAVPLRLPSGIVEGVLFVANPCTLQLRVDSIDRDILERFAFHVATALQTARLLSQKNPAAGRAEILDRVADYILKCTDEQKVHKAFLTGVTANYGLRLNRAFLFMIDDSGNYLVGQNGIGALDYKEARLSWRKDEEAGLVDFGRYVDRLEDGEIVDTVISERIRGMQFDLQNYDLFAEVIRNREEYRIVDRNDLVKLPQFFYKQFRVTSPQAIVPLATSNRTLGILVVDNKFTHSPIDANLLNALTAFARTVSIALENRRLLQERTKDEEQLSSFYEMSRTLASITDPDELLNTLARQTLQTMNAWGATLLLFDSTGAITVRIPVENDLEVDPKTVVRRDGLTKSVLRTGVALPIEDVSRRYDVDPLMAMRGIKAAVCVPLSIPNRTLGVIWLHYDEPRRFSESLIGALQLVLNQASVAYEQVKRIKALEAIRDAAESLAATEDLSGVLTNIVHSALRLFNASAAILWVSDGGRLLPERSVASGLSASLWSVLLKAEPPAIGLTSDAFQNGWFGVADVMSTSDAVVTDDMRTVLDALDARGYQHVPLMLGGEKLGILCTFHKQPFTHDDDQQFSAEEFATHAAGSLKKARLLETLTKATAAAKVVAEVVAAGSQQTVAETLDAIADQSLNALGCSAVVLFASKGGEVIHPSATAGVRNRTAMENDAEKKDYDLVRRLFAGTEPEIISNVKAHPDFMHRRFVHDEGIASCAAIPLRAASVAVGVMLVNYRMPHYFTEAEVADIKMFANQAATAIYSSQLVEDLNAIMAEELRNAEVLIKARTDLAWIGLRTIDWSHSVANSISAILGNLKSLQPLLARANIPTTKLNLIAEELRKMAHPPLPDYDEPEQSTFGIDEKILRQFVDELRKLYDLQDAQILISVPDERPGFVQATPWWLQCVIGYAVKNAMDAFGDQPDKQINISVRLVGKMMEISIENNGPHIPPDLLRTLTEKPVRKEEGQRGQGIGLWVTKRIMQIFGGSASVTNIEPRGVSVLLTLPRMEQMQ